MKIIKSMIGTFMNKEQFLIEHNRLSPLNLQTTFEKLTLFQVLKKPLLKDNEWSFKLRIPLMVWLDLLSLEKKKRIRNSKKQAFKNYPETHNL